MRDHLPVGTVKWMVERALLPGDPATELPGLEQIAEGLAQRLETDRPADVVEAPPETVPPEPPLEPGAAPDDPPPIKARSDRPNEKLASQPILDRALEWINEQGQRAIRPGELGEAINIAPVTRSRVITQLVNEGLIHAVGHRNKRRIFAINPQTSESGHDDSGEGAVPTDPEGETEEGEEASPSDGPREAETPSMQQPPRDDDGGQPDAPVAISTTSIKFAAEETDVELMARVGDLIKQADGEVWPQEIEVHFGIDARRRRTIIGMLSERNRIRVLGADSPQVRYVSMRAQNAGHYGYAEENTGSKPLSLKKPERETVRALPTHEEEIKVWAWAKGQRTFRKRAAVEAFPMLDSDVIAKILMALCNKGLLEPRSGGMLGANAHYVVKGSPKATGKHSDDSHSGTLEGRVMQWLNAESKVTLSRAATHFGLPEDEIKIVLDRLVTESFAMRNAEDEYAAV
jgi:hypothetical protein